eukprot:657943-Pelagomonas_calceolata.AAC.2
MDKNAHIFFFKTAFVRDVRVRNGYLSIWALKTSTVCVLLPHALFHKLSQAGIQLIKNSWNMDVSRFLPLSTDYGGGDLQLF